jgi:broad specificity phosphatase PhoE
MLTFPLPAPLKNNIVLLRSGECYADEAHITQTNPVKKLRQDNALTPKGRKQIIDAVHQLEELNFFPSYIWASNTGETRVPYLHLD